MKKVICFVLVLVVLSSVPSFAEEPGYFPDANLKAAVEAALGKTNPTPTDMLGLTSLIANSKGITNLTGLEYATNLTVLSLCYNHSIMDISPLAGLTSLTALYLDINQIIDIRPLAGLTNLTYLDLSHNQITDISPLAGLTSLTHLRLCDNQISDIGSLAGLTNLLDLLLFNNPLNCPAYDIYIPMIETNNPGIYLTYDPRPAYCDYQPDIDVSPVVYDFGDVELETYRSALITISNTGNGDLTVGSLAFAPDSSLDFVLVPPELPAVIPPEGSIDVEVLFAPTTEGLLTAVLEIGNNDYDEPVVQVSLSGVGVVIEVPPDEQIKQITEFIEKSVAEGTLTGSGPGNSPTKRVNALMNMLESTTDLIVGGYYDDAYAQLVDVLKKCDGQVPPPDFVDGEAREELAEMITELMEDLVEGIEGIPGTSMSKPLSRRSRDFFAGIPNIYAVSPVSGASSLRGAGIVAWRWNNYGQCNVPSLEI